MSGNAASAMSATHDEVSLVDVAVILVRGWKVALFVFVAVLLASALIAWWLPTQYTYSSVYQMAEDTAKPQSEDAEERAQGLEAPEGVLNKTRLYYQPQAIREMLEQQGLGSLPFNVTLTQPDDTLLLVLKSEAAPGQHNNVKVLHQRILQAVAAHQNKQYERVHALFSKKVASLDESIEQLRSDDGANTGQVLVKYQEEQVKASNRLEGLQKGRIEQLASPSESATSLNPMLILIGGAMFGLLLAMMSVFVCHFIKLVAQRLKETA